MVNTRSVPSTRKAKAQTQMQTPLSPLLLSDNLSRKKVSSFSPAPMANVKSASSAAHLPAPSLLFSSHGGPHATYDNTEEEAAPLNYTSTIYKMRQATDCKFIRECPYCDYRADVYPGVKEGHLLGHDEFFDSLPEHEKQHAYVFTRLKCRCPKSSGKIFSRTEGLWRHITNARAPGCMPENTRLLGDWARKLQERGMDVRLKQTMDLYGVTEQDIAASDINRDDQVTHDQHVKMALEAYLGLSRAASAPTIEEDQTVQEVEKGPTQSAFVNVVDPRAAVTVPFNPMDPPSQITWLDDPSLPSAHLALNSDFVPIDYHAMNVQQPTQPPTCYPSAQLPGWMASCTFSGSETSMQQGTPWTRPAEDTSSTQSTPGSTIGSDLEIAAAGPSTPADAFSAGYMDQGMNVAYRINSPTPFFNTDGGFNMGDLLGLAPAGSSLFDEKDASWESMDQVLASAH